MLFYLILHVLQLGEGEHRTPGKEGKITRGETQFPELGKAPKNQGVQDKSTKPRSQKMGARGSEVATRGWSHRSRPGCGPHPHGPPVARLPTPLHVYDPLDLKTMRGPSHYFSVVGSGRKPDTEKRHSDMQISRGETSLPEEEIVVIVIVITPDIIRIIIYIISTTRIISISTSTPSSCSILGHNLHLLFRVSLSVLNTLYS